MAGSKRERDLHKAKVARQEKEAAEAAGRRKRLLAIGGAVVGVLVVIVALVGVAVASNDDDKTATPAASSTPSSSDEPDLQANGKGVTCTKPNGKNPADVKLKASDAKLIPGATYIETMTTNCGKIVFSMDAVNAPTTTATMSLLSDRGFFNNSMCHRMTITGPYVLQCGDPTATGTGGPGFSIKEENLPKAGSDGMAIYKRGTVAMANTGTANSTGSQFFLVYKDSPLPPKYTVLGEITEGQNVLDHIAYQGNENNASDGPPLQPVQIQKMISSATYGAPN